MSAKPILVVIDTQQIKSYVFGTRYLREVRGASLLLDRLNRSETRKLLPSDSAGIAEEIYLGGGSGRVLFGHQEAASRFAERVAELYRREAAGARVSIELIARQEGESFPGWMARGVLQSRRSKLASAQGVPLLGGRWIRPCSSCGREPAQALRRDIQGQHQLCSACLRKREEIKRFYDWPKHNWSLEVPIPSFATLKKRAPDTILCSLAEGMEAHFGPQCRVLLPQDFDQIGKKSRPGNYFGFIYADGNQMGKAIRGMAEEFTDEEEAKAAYRAFSVIVDRATRESAVEAVIDNCEIEPSETHRGETARSVPAEFVMAGGDDLILVVPAHAALPTACSFLELFQKKTHELQHRWITEGRLPRHFAPQGLTISAGVVLAHASYPASQLLGLTKELMKLAKRKAAALAATRPVGTLDFAVIHESGSEALKERRKREYEDESASHGLYLSDFGPPPGCHVRRTERPYTTEDLRKLFDRIRALRESAVPRGKLESLYVALFQSHVQARFDGLRILERLHATNDLEKPPLAELVEDLSCFPFKPAGKELTTPLSEMIEIYDFVPAINTVGVWGETDDA